MRLWLDTEFNGYKGELISMALVGDDGCEWYEVLYAPRLIDDWVMANVMPVLKKKPISLRAMQESLEKWISGYDTVHVVADWPEDIKYFCELLIIGPGRRINTPPLTMEIRRDIGTDESLTPHNALADARALRIMGMGL